MGFVYDRTIDELSVRWYDYDMSIEDEHYSVYSTFLTADMVYYWDGEMESPWSSRSSMPTTWPQPFAHINYIPMK